MKKIALLFVCFTLNGCGGGSSPEPSSTQPPTKTNNSPNVDAGIDIMSYELELLTLNAKATDPDGDALTYKWTRVSGHNSTLENDDILTPSIQLHNTKEVSIEEYKLTVTDEHGASNSDNIIVTVNPVNTPPTYTIHGDIKYEEYNWVWLYIVYRDSDGRIVDNSIEQIVGPELNRPFEFNQGTIAMQFEAPQVTEITTFEFKTSATDDDGAVTEAIISFTIDKRPEQVFTILKGINDTGYTSCTDGFDDTLPCPVAGMPNQDAENGRDKQSTDKLLLKKGSGNAGFDFTKLDVNGQHLKSTASEWACILDNHTGLIWEVKSSITDSIRYSNKLFFWYNPYQDQNGGYAGTERRGDCTETCNTHEYKQAINDLKFCGIDKWTIPTSMQLMTLVDFSVSYPGPLIDEAFFPNTGFTVNNDITWSNESSIESTLWAHGVTFKVGQMGSFAKEGTGFIRLVSQESIKE